MSKSKTNKPEVVRATNNKSTKKRVKTRKGVCAKCKKPFSFGPDEVGTAYETLCKHCAEEDDRKQQQAEEARNKVVFRGNCTQCGKSFYVKAGEANFLKEHGLKMPTRCYECRQANKIEKKKEEEGQQAMTANA